MQYEHDNMLCSAFQDFARSYILCDIESFLWRLLYMAFLNKNHCKKQWVNACSWNNQSSFKDMITHYYKTSNIRRTLDNKTVDHSDVVGASPVGAAPTTSSFST